MPRGRLLPRRDGRLHIPSNGSNKSNLSDAEVASAATYFSSLKPKNVIDVIETDLVTNTYVYEWHLTVANGSDKELIVKRIVEVPKSWSNFSPVTLEPNS
jgi:hypothetical protein